MNRVGISFIVLFQFIIALSQTTVGSGSYSNSFPGVDAAGRNGTPGGSPQISGNALNKPIPTNDWWSFLLKENHVRNLFNYPLTLKTTNSGLVMTYIPFGVIGDQETVQIGVEGLNSSKATVSDYSDWTVSMSWQNSTHNFTATSGIGMPFVYFTKGASDVARVEVKAGTASVSNEILIIQNAQHGTDYVVYAPSGSSWTKNGNVYTSSLNNKNYWSAVMLPQSNTNPEQYAQNYQKYAYVFPSDTFANWAYDENTSVLRTDFTVQTDVKEGSNSTILQGLLPHQWSHLASDSATPNMDTYTSVRGELKMLDGNTFSVENTFKGILPTLPYLSYYSDSFEPSSLNKKIQLLENDNLAAWTDSYNEGQMMNRLIQTARIADETGNVDSRNKIIATIKERLQDWLSYESGEIAFLFYYDDDWTTLLGYPAGHGQDTNINDHHFHWGYFIHAAAFIEQYEPGWANQWGEMVNLLVRDAASYDRNDSQFPFLRNFSPYAGHAWANGFASFPDGNDQESTSESMQFNSSLIHWGTITGNDAIRDLGIYLYTTEQTAVEEYWFDVYERIFSDSYPHSIASRVWGNKYDSGTFWTLDIAAAYGIEMYPIHGGSLYLGHNTDYVQKLWNEITQNTGILNNQKNPNLWHDIYWEFLAFIDPDLAISLYDSYPDRDLKFGVSDAQTYYWLHSMKALGKVDSSITANHPIAAAFNDDGEITYVAQNYSDSEITVSFSDGFDLQVPARELVTSRDVNVGGTLSSDFDKAYNGGSVNLSVTTHGTGITKVELYQNGALLSSETTAPYEFQAENLMVGFNEFYARVYQGESRFGITNAVTVVVGEQKPYLSETVTIPGTIESGNYDIFEGGLGQNISYFDTTVGNNGGEFGDFRLNEYVDALKEQEGATIGWVEPGEWLEYSINVTQTGYYDLGIRYASDLSSGGGPFHLEINGQQLGSQMSVPDSGGWDKWASKSFQNIPLVKGEHILRLAVTVGGFNLGKMTFTYDSALDYSPLIANAGDNVVVIIPETTSQIDGSQSSLPNSQNTAIEWKQIYGPSIISFTDKNALATPIANLEEGIYKLELTLTDPNFTSKDELFVLVQSTANAIPFVTITSPSNNQVFVEGDSVSITTSVFDFDGNVVLVEFFNGNEKIAEDSSAPFNFDWQSPEVGTYSLTAVATDNSGATATSNVANISINQKLSCSFTSNESSSGQFSSGYKMTFETIGNSVKISCQLFDSDKSGAVAYLFKENPFGESPADAEGGNVYSKTVGGLTTGETISYAFKFAFTGGAAVTKYFQYVVGQDCEETQDPAFLVFSDVTKTYGDAPFNLSVSSNSTGAFTYSIDNTNVATLSGSKVTIVGPGTAQVTVNQAADANYLEATTSMTLTVNKATPTIAFTDITKTYGDAPFELSITSNSSGAFTYSVENTNVASLSGNTVTIVGLGNTSITASQAADGFFNSATATMTLTINPVDLDESLVLYPNPVSSLIKFEGIASDNPVRRIEIFSNSGNAVRIINGNIEQVDVRNLSTGLYYIKIYFKDGSLVSRVFIKG